MQLPKYTFVPQPPQFVEGLDPPQERWVKLTATNIPKTRAEQISFNVIVPDAEPWSAQKYDLLDKDGKPTEVTGTNGLIYRYVYDNRGSIVDGAFINSLDDLIEMSGFKETPDKFYELQNPTLADSAVPGIRFWEVSRSINEKAFLDARPTITTGRMGFTDAVFEMNFLPDIIVFLAADMRSLVAQWQTGGENFYNAFGGDEDTMSRSLSEENTSTTGNEFNSNSSFLFPAGSLRDEYIITQIDPTRAFRSADGTYFMGVRFFGDVEINNQRATVGQIVFGNRRVVGFMDADSSAQDIEDLSVNSFGLDGALTSLARPSVVNARQTLLFPRNETDITKKFFRSLYPVKNRGVVEHVPTVCYATEDISLGTLLYGTLGTATFSYKQATSHIGQVTFDIRELT